MPQYATLLTSGSKLTVKAGTQLGQIRERYPHATLHDISNDVDYFDPKDELLADHQYQLILPSQEPASSIVPHTRASAPKPAQPPRAAARRPAPPPARPHVAQEQTAAPTKTSHHSHHLLCNSCGETGHLSMDCQAKSAGAVPMGRNAGAGWSLKRGDFEVTYDAKAQQACYSCGEEGHMSRNCPNWQNRDPVAAPGVTGASGNVRVCFTCGAPDHLQRDCPQRLQHVVSIVDQPTPSNINPLSRLSGAGSARRPEATAAGRVCYSCGETGHLARDCPQRPDPRSQPVQAQPASSAPKHHSRVIGPGNACYTCGQTGHFARDCPDHSSKTQAAVTDPVAPAPGSMAASWLEEGEEQDRKFNQVVANAHEAAQKYGIHSDTSQPQAQAQKAPVKTTQSVVTGKEMKAKAGPRSVGRAGAGGRLGAGPRAAGPARTGPTEWDPVREKWVPEGQATTKTEPRPAVENAPTKPKPSAVIAAKSIPDESPLQTTTTTSESKTQSVPTATESPGAEVEAQPTPKSKPEPEPAPQRPPAEGAAGAAADDDDDGDGDWADIVSDEEAEVDPTK